MTVDRTAFHRVSGFCDRNSTAATVTRWVQCQNRKISVRRLSLPIAKIAEQTETTVPVARSIMRLNGWYYQPILRCFERGA